MLGALSCADRREYEAHLSMCVSCRLAVSELCGLPGLLRRLSPDDVAAIDDCRGAWRAGNRADASLRAQSGGGGGDLAAPPRVRAHLDGGRGSGRDSDGRRVLLRVPGEPRASSGIAPGRRNRVDDDPAFSTPRSHKGVTCHI
ncbi:zf-HC2 domain-containing protein [Mycobacterium intracellulare]|uniref:zf-HC2 domain-containing protein n=1 Tax=Mycobacterium intracellulare TaxID=1767 RepID=UPI00240F7912|nr:zf-HC2 domain-containing protein [Mycobacterium intracellulare]